MILKINVPLRIYSEANMREHWAKKSRRTTEQRHVTRYMVMNELCRQGVSFTRGTVKLIRLAPRTLDSDNLQSAFKAVRDGLADAIKINDGKPEVVYTYDQEQSKAYGFRIEMEALE